MSLCNCSTLFKMGQTVHLTMVIVAGHKAIFQLIALTGRRKVVPQRLTIQVQVMTTHWELLMV